MNDERTSVRSAAVEDRDVPAGFQAVRDALLRQDRPEIERLLYDLERRIEAQLVESREQGLALADANVRSVEIVQRQETLNLELKRQNERLQSQAKEIEEARIALEAQCEAVAAANVEAILMVDHSSEQIAGLDRTKRELSEANISLAEKAEQLEIEASALASANVDAVAMVSEKDLAIRALKALARKSEEEKRQLEDTAFRDVLTGLFNHRYFKEQLVFEIARSRRYERALSMIFLDVDHFKHINDTHGHVTGDEVLSNLGGIINHMIRGADILIRMAGKPFATRYGGEEFALILPETKLEGARCVAERLRSLVESTPFPGGDTQPLGRVTVSGGVATLRPSDSEAARLVRRADDALYRAKQGGRNRIETENEGA